jgi:hypothetical protein
MAIGEYPVTYTQNIAMRVRRLFHGGLAALAIVMSEGALAETLAVELAPPTDDEIAQLCMAHGCDCNCPGCRAYYDACGVPCPTPSGMPPEGLPGASAVPEGAADLQAGAGGEPTVSGPMPSLPAGLGAVAAATSAAPSMIGDFFGGGYQYLRMGAANGATVSAVGGDRVLKFADNNSPIPQNRLFFNFHHFDDPVVDILGREQDADRFTFGLEKTFWDGMTSLEFRIPFTAALDATQTVGNADTLAAEFGNLALAFKILAFRRETLSVGAGLGMVFPTADDHFIFNGGSQPAVIFTNEAYYLQPFIGVYHRPNNRLFSQFITQVNFDVTGNFVVANDSSFGGTGSDRVFEQTLLFLDYSVGYWLYRSKCCSDWITGLAPMVELHYTSTLTPLDLPELDGQIFEADFRRDALNITGGVLVEIAQNTSLRAAGVAPLRDDDLIFDAEFGLQLIRRY